MNQPAAARRPSAVPPSGVAQGVVVAARMLAKRPGRAPRFAHAFDDAAALFGTRLVIGVDPRRLHSQFPYEMETTGGPIDPSRFFLGAGEWSGVLQPIAQSPVYLQAVQLIAADLMFRRTPIYRRLKTIIAAGRSRLINNVEIDTVEKLDDYFRNYQTMLRRARKHGILRRPAVKLDADPALYRTNHARPLWAEVSERDVGVAIDRDGTLHRIGPGKHRTAAAKVVCLERMPCEVRMVHVEWIKSQIPQLSRPRDLLHAIRTLSIPPRSPEQTP